MLSVNRAFSVMSWSTEESRHSDRQFPSPSDAWHTNLDMSYDRPFDVTGYQSAYDCPPTAPYASFNFVPPITTMQIPNSVPNQAVFLNDHPQPSCLSVMPEKQWCQKPDITSTSFCAFGTQTVSKPVQGIAQPYGLSCLSVEDDKCCNSGRNCDNSNATVENCGGSPTAEADLGKISSTLSCNYPAVDVASAAMVVACSNKMDVVTSVSGSDSTAAAAAASSTAPRPKCGRAKTNAELKRQLMERREQRLRDMQDCSPESIVPSSATNTPVSGSLFQQLAARPVVVNSTMLIQQRLTNTSSHLAVSEYVACMKSITFTLPQLTNVITASCSVCVVLVFWGINCAVIIYLLDLVKLLSL